jgi:hypothetical protein
MRLPGWFAARRIAVYHYVGRGCRKVTYVKTWKSRFISLFDRLIRYFSLFAFSVSPRARTVNRR